MRRGPVTGYGIGIALGVLVGMATENLPLWIGVGAALGTAVGVGWAEAARDRATAKSPPQYWVQTAPMNLTARRSSSPLDAHLMPMVEAVAQPE
jgi:hypothetical protein